VDKVIGRAETGRCRQEEEEHGDAGNRIDHHIGPVAHALLLNQMPCQPRQGQDHEQRRGIEMISEDAALDQQHPGNQGGEEADADDEGFGIAVLQHIIDRIAAGDIAHPHDQRIGETGDRVHIAGGVLADVVPDRLDVQQPLIPDGLIRVRRLQIGVVVVHVQNLRDDILRAPAVPPDHGPHVGHIIDDGGNQQEEHAAPQNRADHRIRIDAADVFTGISLGDGEIRSLQFLFRFAELPGALAEVGEQQNGQADSAVAGGPLGGDAHSHRDAAQQQKHHLLPEGRVVEAGIEIADHEVKHQQNPEDAEGLQSGDARGCQMHEVTRKQHGTQSRISGLLKQQPRHRIEQRHQHHAENGSRQTPG